MAGPAKHDGIIVLGHPRSGTTLLRRLLDAHPHIACPGETHIFSACARFLHAETTAGGVDVGVLAGLHFAGFSEAEIVGKLRELAFGFPRAFAQNSGKPRWAEKTAFDSFHIPEIERICGDAVYFVGIIRHALDVAVSCKDLTDAAGTYLGELHAYVQKFPQPMEAFVRSWADVSENLMDFGSRHPDNCILIRYEDLIEEPEDTLSAVLDFVGETFDPATLVGGLQQTSNLGFGDHKSYQTSRIEGSRIGRWNELPQAQIQRLARIANPILEKCGYDPIEITEPMSVEELRRQYETSLLVHQSRGRSEPD